MYLRVTFLLVLFYLVRFGHSAIGDRCSVAQGDGHCDKIADCKTVGWTVPGACPHDPGTVKCCIRQRCAIDLFEGKCLDSAITGCPGGGFKSWLCRGGNNVQCCIPFGPNEAFIEYIRRLYSLAQGYNDPNLRVMEWLRHEDYNGPTWATVLGVAMDQTYLDYVDGQHISMIKTLADNLYAGVQLSVAHAAACMNGAYLIGAPSGTSVNIADFTCWGGDLITFYAEWRRDIDEYPSGKQYALARLAKINVNSTFKLRDLLEDTWGWNMGMTLRSDRSTNIVIQITQLLAAGGDYRTRTKRFVDDRFHGQMKDIARQMLVSSQDTKLALARSALIELNQPGAKLPSMLSDMELDDFLDGFVQVIGDELRNERYSWQDTAPPGAPGHDEL